jgi:hypothetical protein
MKHVLVLAKKKRKDENSKNSIAEYFDEYFLDLKKVSFYYFSLENNVFIF